MKKAIIASTVGSMIKMFSMDDIDLLEELGYSVTLLANFEEGNTMSDEQMKKFVQEMKLRNIEVVQADVTRTPFSLTNFEVYKKLKKMLADENLEIIHTHSPIMSALVRLAANNDRNYKIIYTAHGFHFYKGASLINWLVYYPVEKLLTKITDTLITINEEDYIRASKMAHSNCNVVYFPGIGVEDKFYITKEILKNKSDFKNRKFKLLSVGELNENKNHIVVLKALTKVSFTNFEYTICGRGPLNKEYKEFVNKHNLKDKVILKGFVENIEKEYFESDLFILPSFREGMPKAMMEAMAAGLPVICSNIRGCKDVFKNRQNALFEPNDCQKLVNLIEGYYYNYDKNIMQYNRDKANMFSKQEYMKKIKNIYATQ